jgi:hypothetical protein
VKDFALEGRTGEVRGCRVQVVPCYKALFHGFFRQALRSGWFLAAQFGTASQIREVVYLHFRSPTLATKEAARMGHPRSPTYQRWLRHTHVGWILCSGRFKSMTIQPTVLPGVTELKEKRYAR